jgi:cytochrome c-type biogenesis protein CcmH
VSGLARRTAGVGIVVAFVIALVVAAHGQPAGPAQRANRLDRELRCPVCQGLSVADSTSSTSAAIAADVRRRVDSGQSDAQIRAAYVARYGSWILLDPAGGLGRVAWLAPLVALGAAAGGLAVALRRWSRPTGRVATAEDAALVARARGTAHSEVTL